jgi:hypothetical protein
MTERTLVQQSAAVVGVVFLVVGILGFVPGFTTHYGELSFAGHGSGAKLFNLFQVSVLHNLVHLAFGVAGIVLAKAPGSARTYLIGGGAVYLALWALGVIGGGSWIPVDTADNWLHFLLGAGMIGLGFAATRERSPALRPS